MEEIHRLHKDVPFGWMLMLQQALARRARRKAARRAAHRPDRRPYSVESRFIRGW